MVIWVCDCCGKQMDRFVESYKYTIDKRSKDRNGRASYSRPLDLCDSCRKNIESYLDKKLKNLPEKIEASLCREE